MDAQPSALKAHASQSGDVAKPGVNGAAVGGVAYGQGIVGWAGDVNLLGRNVHHIGAIAEINAVATDGAA